MDLLGVRTQFVKLSGRYDLASADYETDAGADFFITAGLRFLDRRYQTHKSKASYFDEVASGDYYLTFTDCYAIHEVWCNSDTARWKLSKYPYEDIKQAYAGLVSASTGGPPLFYTPIWLRAADATDFESLGAFFNYVKSDDDGSYNGILFAPKADEAFNIEVVGRFYHTLAANTDKNYWTLMRLRYARSGRHTF
ncbi:MAG: hypothetical protein ACWGQW_06000, partial [bacterium]